MVLAGLFGQSQKLEFMPSTRDTQKSKSNGADRSIFRCHNCLRVEWSCSNYGWYSCIFYDVPFVCDSYIGRGRWRTSTAISMASGDLSIERERLRCSVIQHAIRDNCSVRFNEFFILVNWCSYTSCLEVQWFWCLHERWTWLTCEMIVLYLFVATAVRRDNIDVVTIDFRIIIVWFVCEVTHSGVEDIYLWLLNVRKEVVSVFSTINSRGYNFELIYRERVHFSWSPEQILHNRTIWFTTFMKRP